MQQLFHGIWFDSQPISRSRFCLSADKTLLSLPPSLESDHLDIIRFRSIVNVSDCDFVLYQLLSLIACANMVLQIALQVNHEVLFSYFFKHVDTFLSSSYLLVPSDLFLLGSSL